MEFEQIVKHLDWLDEEHRKDKAALESFSERLNRIESELGIANKKLKEMEGQTSRYSTLPARIEQYDVALTQQRKEIVKYVDDLDKKQHDHVAELEKGTQKQFDGLQVQKYYTDTRKAIAELKREHKAFADEEPRREKLLKEWAARMELMVKNVDEVQRNQKVTEESHRQNSKRLVDLQGDVTATHKRMDDVNERSAVVADGLRRVETRLNEVVASEAERKQMQLNFIETQARLQVERERTWKEWEERLETLRKQTDMADRNLQEWDAIQRAIRRAQETYEEIVQKFERRINEITEMQRLAEDRFRQEWVTFRADDQKRWTSYTLTQDEAHKDTRAGLAKLEERLVSLEDLSQTQQDVLQQTRDANEQLFQGMVAQIHELLSSYERITGTK